MEEYFSKTSIGYNHVKDGIVCQDYSACCKGVDDIVLTVCDGHGGRQYIRSDRGARFASYAAVTVLIRNCRGRNKDRFTYADEHKVKLEILCEWNKLVERDYAEHPFAEEELADLDENQRSQLTDNYVIAYGTTLNAVYITQGFQLFVNIGDGDMFFWDNDQIFSVFGGDENVANITHSLCSDDAYDRMRVTDSGINGDISIVLCTDGIVNPYASYENLENSFLKPLLCKVKEGKTQEVQKFVEELASKKGTGDDVSLAIYVYKDEDSFADCFEKVAKRTLKKATLFKGEENFDNNKFLGGACIGINDEADRVLLDFDNFRGMLVMGQFDSGKRLIASSLIASLLISGDIQRVKIALLGSLSMVDCYANLLNTFCAPIESMQDSVAVMQQIVAELHLRKAKVKQGDSIKQLPYILLIMDNLFDFMFFEENMDTVTALLKEILLEGAEVKIGAIIMASCFNRDRWKQYFDGVDIDTIVFKEDVDQGYLPSGYSAMQLAFGEAYYVRGGNEPEKISACYLTEGDMLRVIEKYNKRYET